MAQWVQLSSGAMGRSGRNKSSHHGHQADPHGQTGRATGRQTRATPPARRETTHGVNGRWNMRDPASALWPHRSLTFRTASGSTRRSHGERAGVFSGMSPKSARIHTALRAAGALELSSAQPPGCRAAGRDTATAGKACAQMGGRRRGVGRPPAQCLASLLDTRLRNAKRVDYRDSSLEATTVVKEFVPDPPAPSGTRDTMPTPGESAA